MVDLPELSKPTTRTLHSFFLSPKMLARRSKRPMIQYSKRRSRTEKFITDYNHMFFFGNTEYYKHSDVSFFFHYISRATLKSVPLSLTDKKVGKGREGSITPIFVFVLGFFQSFFVFVNLYADQSSIKQLFGGPIHIPVARRKGDSCCIVIDTHIFEASKFSFVVWVGVGSSGISCGPMLSS